MFVGLLSLELFIPQAQSLKEKRFILKSLKDRIKNGFNVSIAEVDGKNLWQRSTIGVAMVSDETLLINQTAVKIRTLLESISSIEILESKLELL